MLTEEPLWLSLRMSLVIHLPTQKHWLRTALRTWRVRTFKNRAQVLRNDKLKKGLEWGLKAAS